MDLISSFLQPRGMDILAAVVGMSEEDLITRGASDAHAKALLAAAHTFFGSTAHSRYQRRSQAAGAHHPVDVLLMISAYARKIPDATARWQFIEHLAGSQLPATALRRVAEKMVKAARTKKAPTRGIRIRRHSKRLASLAITARTDLIEDLFNSLDAQEVDKSLSTLLSGPGSSTGSGPGCDARIGNGAGQTGQATGQSTGRPTLIAHGVMQLPEFVASITGVDSPAGGVVHLTSGGSITLREFVERELADYGLVTVVDRVAGPVDQFRVSRLASPKQRDMAYAESQTCCWPGCNVPAARSQVHHMHAWQHGGMTNMNNLTLLCEGHNRINDDDPNAPPRYGRIERPRAGGPPTRFWETQAAKPDNPS